VTSPLDALPSDLATAHAMILAERAARLSAEAEAKAESTNADAMIAHLRLEIEKLRRALYGVRSERKARLLDAVEFCRHDQRHHKGSPIGAAFGAGEEP
jgi:transposase